VLAALPVVVQYGTYTYVYGLDLISMTDGSSNQKYFSYDGLGSVTDITNGSGTVTDTFVYDVFGVVTARSGSTVSIGKFTGEQADDAAGDSGFYFLRARHYDPATGRFIGKDNVQFAQRYVYGDNNPALLIDPTGECAGPVSKVCKAIGNAAKEVKAYGNRADCVSVALTTTSIALVTTGLVVSAPAQPFVVAGAALYAANVQYEWMKFNRGDATRLDVWNAVLSGGLSLGPAALELGANVGELIRTGVCDPYPNACRTPKLLRFDTVPSPGGSAAIAPTNKESATSWH
jgi:RHS repeat-associated protein